MDRTALVVLIGFGGCCSFFLILLILGMNAVDALLHRGADEQKTPTAVVQLGTEPENQQLLPIGQSLIPMEAQDDFNRQVIDASIQSSLYAEQEARRAADEAASAAQIAQQHQNGAVMPFGLL